MKIAIIGSRGYPYVYSGYETLVRELSQRLVAQGHEVLVYCHKGLFDPRPKKVNEISLRYIPSIETKVLSQLSHSFLAFIDVCFQKVDVVLAVNTANGPFGLITRLAGIPTTINVDGLEWLRPKWNGFGSKYFYWASRLATKSFDVIINDSYAMQEFYTQEFRVESKVIAYGAELKESKFPERIQKWNLSENNYYLIVGRLIPDNNADIIIREFLKSGSKRKLVIVGDVPYQDEFAEGLKNLAKVDERLMFTGYVTDQDDLAELYHNSYMYFHGHEYGGTNPTMLKALAYGTAILALNTSFNQEMLQAGKFGEFFSKDEGDLSKRINDFEVVEDKVLQMKVDSRNGITQRYTWDYVAKQYEAVFLELSSNALK